MSKLGPCAICQGSARYTCPRCSLQTCSLSCSKLHKSQISPPCSGIAKQVFETAVQANQFSWGGIMRDQSWLSEVGRKVEGTGKELVKGGLIPAMNGGREGRLDGFSEKEQGIVGNAARYENVKLLLLPKGMSRRLKNVTKWQTTTKSMEWTTEFILPPSTLPLPVSTASDLPTHTITSLPQLATRTLVDILTTAIAMRDKKGKAKALQQSGSLDSTIPTIEQIIQEASSAEMEWVQSLTTSSTSGSRSIFILLLAVVDLPPPPPTEDNDEDDLSPLQPPAPIPRTSKGKNYYLIPPSSTLRDAIIRTTILEFPTFSLLSKEDFERDLKEGRINLLEKPSLDVTGFGSVVVDGRGKNIRGGRGGRGGARGGSRGGREGGREIIPEDRKPDAGWSKRARMSTVGQDVEVHGEKKVKLGGEIEFEFELSTGKEEAAESAEMESGIGLVGYDSE